MLALLFQLIIVAIVCGLILYLAALVPGVAPFAQAIRAVVICFFIIYLIYLLWGLLSTGHPPGLVR